MNRSSIMTYSRMAGQVVRYHTWPVFRQQSVAEHTWQCLRIWFHIFGPPDPDVTSHILWHDCGELRVGDLPFPFKAGDPALKDKLQSEENKAISEMGGWSAPLGDDDQIRFKIVELLEMHEFGLTEYHMGNRFALPIVQDTLRKAEDLTGTLSSVERGLIDSYVKSVHKRFSEDAFLEGSR